MVFQGRSQLFVKGGPRPKILDLFANFVQRSCENEVNPKLTLIGQGPRPALGPWKLLDFLLLNMQSLHFEAPFYTIFEITIISQMLSINIHCRKMYNLHEPMKIK